MLVNAKSKAMETMGDDAFSQWRTKKKIFNKIENEREWQNTVYIHFVEHKRNREWKRARALL